MAEIEFTFEGNSIIIQCNKNQKMKDICNKLSTKININLNSLIFLYGGNILNFDKTFNEISKENKISILVFEEENFELEKKKNGLQISMELIKIFKEISQEEAEDKICEFIQKKGLPMPVNSEETLALILYFHKLCVPFYKILFLIDKKKKILKTFLLSLKESYSLFADTK